MFYLHKQFYIYKRITNFGKLLDLKSEIWYDKKRIYANSFCSFLSDSPYRQISNFAKSQRQAMRLFWLFLFFKDLSDGEQKKTVSPSTGSSL